MHLENRLGGWMQGMPCITGCLSHVGEGCNSQKNGGEDRWCERMHSITHLWLTMMRGDGINQITSPRAVCFITILNGPVNHSPEGDTAENRVVAGTAVIR